MKNRTLLQWFVATLFVMCGSGDAVSQTDFWQETDTPFGRTVGSVASNASSDIFVGTDAGVFRSTDDGVTWTSVNSGLNPDSGYVVFTSRGTIFAWAAWANGGHYHTTDNGSNWTQLIHAGGPVFKTAVAINDSGYIFGGWGHEQGGGVERSTDNGATWTSTGLAANSYALSISASGTIFSGGWHSSGACVFRSTDNGSSWTNTGSFGFYYPVNTLAISPAGHIFAGTSDHGVFHSTDDGAHWVQSTSGMRTSRVTDLAINSIGHIFAGAFDEGVYRSTDDGANWIAVNSGLTDGTVLSIAINPSGTIFVATQNGLFRSAQSTTSVRNLSANAPPSLSLEQNYPNPFNPSTTIRYGLPIRSHVTLTVYNTLGQQVATMVDGEMEAGLHESVFDASGLASGVYVYRLKAGSFVEAHKFVLVR